ncbi:MAG: hypothetical protein A4S09_10695 [Proteobacteria bacterium SG_bin7]|nr:MAG: hypothetical protein A4S09_10695 [Proteobacteria bacterium SG_bin7]
MAINAASKVIRFLVLVVFFQATSVNARDVIAVVSDIHLVFGNPAHPNQETFNNFLKVMKSRREITDIVINGDIFDGPSLVRLARQQRIDVIVGVLRYVQNETGVRIHFNLGNHDQLAEHKEGKWVVDESFSLDLKAAIEEAGIAVIGTDPRKIYRYSIGATKLEISHFPFATSKEMVAQAERFSWHQRAHAKTTNVSQNVLLSDEFTRVMGDSHTPLEDTRLKIFNAGKLAETSSLPLEPNTFLITRNGRGRLMVINSDGTVSRFKTSSITCRSLF